MKANILLGRKALNQTVTSNPARSTTVNVLASKSALRAKLRKHKKLLEDFVSITDPNYEFMASIEVFAEADEKLRTQGLKAFSDAELQEVVFNIQEFRAVCGYWAEALQPLAELRVRS